MQRELKVAYVTCYLDVSGVTKINFDILGRLKNRGFDTHVITTEGTNDWDYMFEIYIGNPFHLDRISKNKRLSRFVEYIADNKIEVIFNTHSLWVYENLPSIKRILPHIKAVDSLHVLEPYCFRGGYPDISGNKYVHPLIDKSILISENLKNYLLNNYEINPDKLTVIRNGIDTSKFALKENYKGRFKNELALKDGGKLIGFIGRLVGQKRPLMFLEIARQMLSEDESCFFYLIGAGKLEDKVIEFINKNNLSGRVFLFKQRHDIDRILNSTDLLLVPSLYEGAPLTILEALSTGVPVIASDVGGIREYVGNCSVLIDRTNESREIETFVRESLSALCNPQNLQNAVRHIRENYDIDKTAEEYANVFLKVRDSQSD